MPENGNEAAVAQAFEALRTYDFGTSRAALKPIDEAVRASLGEAGARRDLERRLADALGSDAPAPAREYACRQLQLIGTAESAPALADLLADERLSHAARAALEHIPAAEAVGALRASLARLAGRQRAGVILALGMRRDAESVPALADLLQNVDAQTAGAAATALGNIATPEAARALLAFRPKAPEAIAPAVADACLACAEQLAAAGRKAGARALYEALRGADQPEHVRLAAQTGLENL